MSPRRAQLWRCWANHARKSAKPWSRVECGWFTLGMPESAIEAAGRLQAEIAAVISNREEARGLEIARQRGLPALCIPSKGVSREEYDLRVVEELQARNVE